MPKRTDSKPPGRKKSAAELPRHRAIYEELLGEIRNGHYKHGSRLPSETLLCERFQASRITVAKALQKLQSDKLVVRRRGSGTYLEQAPIPGSPMRFGLLIPDLGTTEIFEPICQGMMRSTVAQTHSLSWGHSLKEGCDRELAAENLCRQYIDQRVAGVFFAPMEFTRNKDCANRRILEMLLRAGMPVVLLDHCVEPYPERSKCDLVGIDNHRAGYLLTQHLLEAGARRLLFVARAYSASTVDMRIAGYRDALFKLQGQSDGRIVIGDFEDPAFVGSMLDQEQPDAIVCANDLTAARLMHTLLALGVRIPEDIKLVGVDDVRYARFLPVPLTTIRQHCGEIGAVAMATMLERVEHPDHPVRDVLVRCDLVIRASSGTLPSCSRSTLVAEQAE